MDFRRNLKGMSLKTKLYLLIAGLLVVSCLIVGVPSTYIARNELDQKGETILKNSVKSALQFIDDKNNEVERGSLTLKQAQEQVKVYLMGKKNPDGTRKMNKVVDLGANGYYLIYDFKGNEVLHPTMEGKNVWAVKDYSSKPFLLVQDQIEKGKKGGGFTYYKWPLPNTNIPENKVSYAQMDPNWNWIVAATSYLKDYNSGAYKVTKAIIVAYIFLLLFGGIIAFNFVRGLTRPLQAILNGMKQAEIGNYITVEKHKNDDEIGELVNGFNRMVHSVNIAYTDLLSLEQRTHYFAYYDQTTGLPNQNLFKDQVSNRMQQSGIVGYLVLVQIKDYDNIISLNGNEHGEKMLELLGKKLLENKYPDSLVARLSINEFAAWIENRSLEQAISMQMRMKRIVLNEFEKQGFGRLNNFIISYTVFPDDGLTFNTCMQKAKIAMQFAKQNSSTEPVAYAEDFFVIMQKEARILELAELDMQRNRFRLFYQGKWDLEKEGFCGVEALARWESEELGRVGPGIFIPILTRANMMCAFSEYILEKALDDYPEIEKRFGDNVSVSINIPHDFFYKENFTDYIRKQIEARNIKPENIILEITEDTLIESLELVREITQQLQKFGVRVSLDDFGTGYSSLSYLMSIQFDEIKIDKSFIDNLQRDEKFFQLFYQIVQIAKTFQSSVVAEGVERGEQTSLIQSAGCNVIQGYLFSFPEPLHAAGDMKQN